MYITIVGNIGAGKTTLTRLLSKHYGWVPKYESVDNNPYLVDFYNNMQRWSYNLQIYFLNKRIKDILDISKQDEIIIQDRCIFEDRYMFAPTLLEQGNLEQRDFNTYTELFDTMVNLVPKPDLIIYIRSTVSNLVSQIEKRNRGCESGISINYLSSLNKKYEEWAKTYDGKLLTIDGDICKFENDEECFKTITKGIENLLKE